jgi:hypothetical protein
MSTTASSVDPKINPLVSKTVWGAILWVIGFLTQPGVLSALPEKVAAVIQAVGIVLGAIGVRHAIAKAAIGVVQSPLIIGLLAVMLTVAGVLPTNVLFHQDSGYCTAGPVLDCTGAVGDSLRYVVMWKQPPDTASKGKIDSTFYRFTATKGVTFYGSSGVLTPNTPVRRSLNAGVLADSLKLAKTALGDSVVFQITNFVQCRKGDCSLPGALAWKYRETFAPPPASPTVRIETF